MDINKLNHAHELLDKSQATQNLIDFIKDINTSKTIDINEIHKSMVIIKDDLFDNLLKMKNTYNNEFAAL